MLNLDLQATIQHLSLSSHVKGIFTTGSTASGLTLSSDIDLVVILDRNEQGIKSAYTLIEGRFADIFFFDLDFVKTCATLEKIPANGFEGIFLTWLAKGKVEKDEMGMLADLKAKMEAKSPSFNISLEEKQDSWFKINYNFIANQRYFHSEDSLYHNALEIRLLYSVTELIVAYFTLRDIPWRGEKEAIKYFEMNDKSTFQIFVEYTQSQSLLERFHAYEKLFQAVMFGAFYAWEKDFFIVKDAKNQVDETLTPIVQKLLWGLDEKSVSSV